MIHNENFLKDRQKINAFLRNKDKVGDMVIAAALSEPLFVTIDGNFFQMIGVNASFIKEKYVEIFVAVDLTTTMQHFDGNAVKAFYFDVDSLDNLVEVTETIAKNGCTRPEWRRIQKFIDKNKKLIINKTDYDHTPPQQPAGMLDKMYNS